MERRMLLAVLAMLALAGAPDELTGGSGGLGYALVSVEGEEPGTEDRGSGVIDIRDEGVGRRVN